LFGRGAADAIVTTGMTKPLDGGSVRQVASDHHAPTAGCHSHGNDAKPRRAGNDATGCSLVGSKAIEWRPRVPEVLGEHFPWSHAWIKSSG
jgi:hypothetical protein